MKYIRIAAERGDAESQFTLGWSYENSFLVENNYSEAVRWYRKAAEQKYIAAQRSIGHLYEDGLGVDKDYFEAVKWYRKAAEQGDEGAQGSLGHMYYMGYGVEQDYAEAARWYRKAAEKGWAQAQYVLGLLYQSGTGVSKDLTQAKYWYEKAATQGNVKAKEILSELEELTNSQESVNQSSSDSKTGVETFTVNGVSFNMIRVEGGTFQMGATSEQGSDAFDWEKPVHQVTLSSFSIGETEVTQELWEVVMGTNPSKFKDAKHSVENVSWNDCQEFIRKLNDMTGKKFRLPTEAEWEYAARGGKKSQGYKYSGSNTIDDVAWYTNTTNDKGTHDVKTKKANELGLYDMSGNVYEWCLDSYGGYSSSSQMNPKGPSSGSYRVCRGGYWSGLARVCRVSFRLDRSQDDSGDYLGLRLAL